MHVDLKASQASPSSNRRELFWGIWAVTAAFGTYFCMYGFRKPFTAASFDDASLWEMPLKPWLVTSQMAGYMVSKFLGIKVISELSPKRRAIGILILIAVAQAALVLFGLTPRPWNAIWLFVNGLPLGMVFGMVLGCLEGRRMTEALTAGLCASFILADGVTKSAGSWLLSMGVAEDWMPSVAGMMFLLPLTLGVGMLTMIPPPTTQDVAERTARVPLSRSERWALFQRHAGGLTLLIIMYLVITILRSVRADFAPELWRGLGEPAQPATFTHSELFVALGVLAINGGTVLIRDNRRAFMTALAVCGLGIAMIAGALLGREVERLDGFGFMVVIGLGLYLPYVAMHTTVFERLLAMTRDRGNIGFLMYVADSIGYLGYVAVILLRMFWTSDVNFVGYFTWLCWLAVVAAAVCLLLSWRYFQPSAEAS